MSDSVNPAMPHEPSSRDDRDEDSDHGADFDDVLGGGLEEVLGEYVDTTHNNALRIAELSRDIRDGLTTIIGYSDMLLEDVSPVDVSLGEDIELQRIHGAGRRLLATVEQLESMVAAEQDQRQIAETLRALVTMGAESQNLEEFVTGLFARVVSIIDYSAAQLWIKEDAGLELVAGDINDSFLTSEETEERRIPELQAHVLNGSAEQNKGAFVLDCDESQELNHYAPPIEHWLCVPLSDEETGQEIGLLVFGRSEQDTFDRRSHQVAKRIGSHVSTILVRLQYMGRIQDQAKTDPLTGIANRRYFFVQARQHIKRARHGNAPVSLLLLDIDHFKEFNDSHGHLVGDRVLTALSHRLGECLRGDDLLGRYGGEEFVVLLPDTDIEPYGIKVAERLRKAVEELEIRTGQGATLRCTVSIGIAAMNQDDKDLVSLIGEADEALYEAKAQGRNRVEIHDSY